MVMVPLIMAAKKVVVVGGGIVGCLTALELVNRGCQVTLVERNVVASQTSGESSWAGAGILFPLLPWMYKDEVNQLALAGAGIYPTLCKHLLTTTGIDPELITCGMQILAPMDVKTATDWCLKNNIVVQANSQGLFLPSVAQVRPPQLLKALRLSLLQSGVDCGQVWRETDNGKRVSQCGNVAVRCLDCQGRSRELSSSCSS